MLGQFRQETSLNFESWQSSTRNFKFHHANFHQWNIIQLKLITNYIVNLAVFHLKKTYLKLNWNSFMIQHIKIKPGATIDMFIKFIYSWNWISASLLYKNWV